MSVTLEIAGGRAQFRPGEMLEGTVSLTSVSAPADVEVLLSWRTEGKGTKDMKVIETLSLGSCKEGRTPFKLKIPDAPYSFSGKLISLIWGVEATTNRSAQSDPVQLTISPTGSEILLKGK